MKINIRNIFEDNLFYYDSWRNFLMKNFIPFPVQMNFLLNKEDVEAIVRGNNFPDNPLLIYGIFRENSIILIGTLIVSIQADDESAELTHLVLDKKVRKTFLSDRIMYKTGEFIDILFVSNNVKYAQCSVPLNYKRLEQIFIKFKWEKKAVLKSYQKMIENSKTFRQDVIYFEKIYN